QRRRLRRAPAGSLPHAPGALAENRHRLSDRPRADLSRAGLGRAGRSRAGLSGGQVDGGYGIGHDALLYGSGGSAPAGGALSVPRTRRMSLARTFARTTTISTRMMKPSVVAGPTKVATARPARKPASVGRPALAGSG